MCCLRGAAFAEQGVGQCGALDGLHFWRWVQSSGQQYSVQQRWVQPLMGYACRRMGLAVEHRSCAGRCAGESAERCASLMGGICSALCGAVCMAVKQCSRAGLEGLSLCSWGAALGGQRRHSAGRSVQL